MASSPARKRLIQAALDLFVSQGVSSPTTRQIANLAGVNEVTLFRNFGNKYGLLLAVIDESPTFTQLATTLSRSLPPEGDLAHQFRAYLQANVGVLVQVPELVRSLIGEADQYPLENRQAIGRRLTEATRTVAAYFQPAITAMPGATPLPADEFVAILHALLLGYAVIECTSADHHLWPHREGFMAAVTRLFLPSEQMSAPASSAAPESALGSALAIAASGPFLPGLDLPQQQVHAIVQAARKAGPQDYALVYVLFGAGLLPAEVIPLQRIHHSSDAQQQTLRLIGPQGYRQVPVNQWIAAKRHGSPKSNPLTKWLKHRKDGAPALFLDDAGGPLSLGGLQRRWNAWSAGLLTPEGHPPALVQAHHTWCVDMLMRGLDIEALSILTGQPVADLQPYGDRAREKAALEQAVHLDRPPGQPSPAS
jgi:AcrR family transcriptional regulator